MSFTKELLTVIFYSLALLIYTCALLQYVEKQILTFLKILKSSTLFARKNLIRRYSLFFGINYIAC